jgi:hypothetical protein
MPSTPPAAAVFDYPEFTLAVRMAFANRGLPDTALRIVAQHNADVIWVHFPGYSPIHFSWLEIIDTDNVRALIEARLTDMLNLPVI